MSDPFSIIAGVAGIACAAVQLSKSLHDISNRLINAPQEIDDIASELDSLGSIFKLICKTLKSNRHLVKPELITNVIEARNRFQALQKDVQYLIANAKDFKGLRWLFRRERVSALMTKIAALKSNIQLVLSIIDIAVSASASKAKPRKKKPSEQLELGRFDRVVAENYAEAIRQSIKRLRVESIKAEQFQKTGGELLQLHYWKEPLGRTAAWLYYRTLFPAIESPTTRVRDSRGWYARTVATHQEDDIATDNEAGDDSGRQRHFAATATVVSAAIPADEEDELHVTRDLGHKVVNHLLGAWTTLSKHQITENGRAAAQLKKSGSYEKAIQSMIRGCLKQDQPLEASSESQGVEDAEARNGHVKLADLEGRVIQSSGEVYDDHSAVIGRLVQGNAVTLRQNGAVCDRYGNVLHGSKMVGKVAIAHEQNATSSKDQQEEYPPVPDAPRLSLHSEKPTSPVEKTPFSTNAADKDREPQVVTRKSTDKVDSVIPLSALEGLCCDRDGLIKDTSGSVIGKITEGDPEEFSSKKRFCDARGNVLDYNSRTIGKCTAISKMVPSNPVDNDDSTTALGGSQKKSASALVPPQLPLLEEVQDVESETVNNTAAPSLQSLGSRKPVESVTDVEELGGSSTDATPKPKSVTFDKTDGTAEWRKFPPMIVPWKPSPAANTSRSASTADQDITHLVAKSEEHIDQPKAPANSPSDIWARRQTATPSASRLSARTPTQSTLGFSQQQNSSSTSSYRTRSDGQIVGMGVDPSTGSDPFQAFNQYQAMMPYEPQGAYAVPYDSYAYPPVLYDHQLAQSQRKSVEKNDRISQLESQVRAQEHLMRLQEITRAREREEDALQRKRDEEREIEERRRIEGMEEIAKMMKDQNEKAVMMEKEVLARARAAEEATQNANRKMEKLQLRSQEMAVENARALKAAKDEAAMFAERAAKAMAEVDEQKSLAHSSREEAEKAKLAIVAEYTERIRKESEAKVTAETAHRFAEEKCRELQKAQLKRPAVPPEVPNAPQYAYPMPTIAECYGEASDDDDVEVSETVDTETEDAASEFWPASTNQSLRRVRVQQEDLEDDPSHKIIFPMRSGWKEHEMKTITKSMSRFGYTPLYEEVEAPCMPNQFYEIPGSGGCNLRGTALWQPPGPTLASELHTSYLKSGWKHTYVRANEYGETWFLGRQPIHSVMFTINYIPQASADDEYSRINHHHSEGGRLYISKEWVEKETLDELGYKNMFLSDWRVSLDPSLTHADIETAVARSFFLRETRLRKKYRNFTPLPSSTVKRIENLGTESDTESTTSFAPSVLSANKPSRFRSLISRSNSRSGGFSWPRN